MNEDDMEVVKVDEFVPDYTKRCEVCGADHVVTGKTNGKVVYQGEMCGVCTWGEAAMHDPSKWRE